MDLILLTFFTAFGVVLFSTPSLIKVAILKRLFDEPTESRKLHSHVIPTVGGIIIFAGTFFSFVLWFPTDSLLDIDVENSNYMKNAISLQTTKAAINDFKYILASVFVLFFVGAKDDIIGTAPIKRLAAHILVALIIVLMADIRIKSMHGIFNAYEIPYWSSIFLSLFAIIVIINAFNFIDGIDGLAAGIALIAANIYGVWFYMCDDIIMSLLAFSLAGSLLAFLFYNFSPAKIFMGDSGSTTIGLLLAVLSIKAIETPSADISDTVVSEIHRPIFVMATLCYPLIDTLRIFIYRSVRGISPFEADKNHIHHVLIGTGMNHKMVSTTLYLSTLLMVGLTYYFRWMNVTTEFFFILSIAVILTQAPFFFKRSPVAKLKNEAEVKTSSRGKISEEVKKQLFQENDFKV